MMRVMIGCGGTGGHITPALAIAETVLENIPSASILFVGAKGGMEEELVRDAGFALCTLRVKGLSRSLTPANLKALYLAATAVQGAKALVREFAPDVVIGTGGYACYPVLRAALSLGVPTAVHESNARAGLAVRRLAARVDRVWLNFAVAAETLPRGARVLQVGNPLRARHAGGDLPRRGGAGARYVLSFGGSLGAAEINRAVLSLMEREQGMPHIYHLHATGKREFEGVRAAFVARGLDRCPRLQLTPFISDMGAQMARADVVISRAGAMSISELSAACCPAVLIPSPNVTGNHQYHNARALSDKGAAVLLPEEELSGGGLVREVMALLGDDKRRAALSAAIASFATPDANRRIFEDMKRLARRG